MNKLTTGRQCGQALAFDIHPGLLEPLCLLTILGMEFLLLRNTGVFKLSYKLVKMMIMMMMTMMIIKNDGNRTSCRPVQSAIIQVINKIG